MTGIEVFLAVLVALDVAVSVVGYRARRREHKEFMARMRERFPR